MGSIVNTNQGLLPGFKEGEILKKNGQVVSVNTFKSYNRQVLYFNKWLLSEGKGLNKDTVQEYFDYLKQPKRRGGRSQESGSLQVAKFALKRAIAKVVGDSKANLWANDKMFEKISTGTKVKTITEADIFTREQIRDLVLESEDRPSCVMAFLYFTACRVGELINAKIKNCKFNGYVKILVEGKGRKRRTVGIPMDLYKRIEKVFPGKEKEKKEFLFENNQGGQLDQGNIFRMLQGASQKVLFPGLKTREQPISCHKFRHSRAKHLLNMGVDIKALSLFLGHADVSTTAEYYLASSINIDEVLNLDQIFMAGKNKKAGKTDPGVTMPAPGSEKEGAIYSAPMAVKKGLIKVAEKAGSYDLDLKERERKAIERMNKKLNFDLEGIGKGKAKKNGRQ